MQILLSIFLLLFSFLTYSQESLLDLFIEKSLIHYTNSINQLSDEGIEFFEYNKLSLSQHSLILNQSFDKAIDDMMQTHTKFIFEQSKSYTTLNFPKNITLNSDKILNLLSDENELSELVSGLYKLKKNAIHKMNTLLYSNDMLYIKTNMKELFSFIESHHIVDLKNSKHVLSFQNLEDPMKSLSKYTDQMVLKLKSAPINSSIRSACAHTMSSRILYIIKKIR